MGHGDGDDGEGLFLLLGRLVGFAHLLTTFLDNNNDDRKDIFLD